MAWPGSRARSAAPSSSPSRAASATARRYSLLRPEDSGRAGPGCAAGGTRRPGRGGRSAQRAAGRPARCAAAAPAPTMPQPRRANGNRTAAARAAAPARRQSPGCGGPPPASHARRRPAPGTGTPVRRLHQDHRRQPAPRVRYPRPGSPLLQRGASHPRHRTPCAAPARPLACQRGGVKPSQNRRLVSSDHGPRTSNSATRPAIACSVRFTDTRTVADGTDTNIDRARAPTDQRADHPNRRGRLARRSWPRRPIRSAAVASDSLISTITGSSHVSFGPGGPIPRMTGFAIRWRSLDAGGRLQLRAEVRSPARSRRLSAAWMLIRCLPCSWPARICSVPICWPGLSGITSQ